MLIQDLAAPVSYNQHIVTLLIWTFTLGLSKPHPNADMTLTLMLCEIIFAIDIDNAQIVMMAEITLLGELSRGDISSRRKKPS